MQRMLFTLLAVWMMTGVGRADDAITIGCDGVPLIIDVGAGNYTIYGYGTFAAPANTSVQDPATGDETNTVYFTDAVRVRSRKNNVSFGLNEWTTSVPQYGGWGTDTTSTTTYLPLDYFDVQVRAEGRKIVYKNSRRNGTSSSAPSAIAGVATFTAVDW